VFSAPSATREGARHLLRQGRLFAEQLAKDKIEAMSSRAEMVLEQFNSLPQAERQQVLAEMLDVISTAPAERVSSAPFPTVRLPGGTITSEQVAEELDE
jgi:hypothetical protein